MTLRPERVTSRSSPADPWSFLRELTAARIALGRAGGSLPTRELLDFGLAHARARDAVAVPFDAEGIAARLNVAGLGTVVVSSAADDRAAYLKRPDLGRRLNAASRDRILTLRRTDPPYDLAAAVSDGLSAPAAHRQAIPLLAALLPELARDEWKIAPIVVVQRGRVAIQDEIGELLGATIALILLGERPGLGAPDSLGAYFVHGPQIGRADADRNCVSNIRPEGLPIRAAAETLRYLLTLARARQLSGISLKDDRGRIESRPVGQKRHFVIDEARLLRSGVDGR